MSRMLAETTLRVRRHAVALQTSCQKYRSDLREYLSAHLGWKFGSRSGGSLTDHLI
jgi:hypothetical protein